MLSSLLLVLLCGMLDRSRGDGVVNIFYSKTVEALLYGLAVAALLGLSIYVSLLFCVLWATGASFGWGTPLSSLLNDTSMSNHGYEWWQFWILKKYTLLACAFRGFMWGACVAPLMYFDVKVGYLAAAMIIIFPLSIKLATIEFKPIEVERWALQEYYRGWTVGIVAFVTGVI